MNITDDKRRRIEEHISERKNTIELYRRAGLDELATQTDNWLFGFQLALDMLGLHELAMLAHIDDEVDTKE